MSDVSPAWWQVRSIREDTKAREPEIVCSFGTLKLSVNYLPKEESASVTRWLFQNLIDGLWKRETSLSRR